MGSWKNDLFMVQMCSKGNQGSEEVVDFVHDPVSFKMDISSSDTNEHALLAEQIKALCCPDWR